MVAGLLRVGHARCFELWVGYLGVLLLEYEVFEFDDTHGEPFYLVHEDERGSLESRESLSILAVVGGVVERRCAPQLLWLWA